jgi:cytochrome c2
MLLGAAMAIDVSGAAVDGHVLLGERHCTACHAVGGTAASWITPKTAPLLTGLAGRADADWVRRFLAAPDVTLPGTTMPDVLHRLPGADREDAAEALTHHLLSSATPAAAVRVYPDKAAIARGEALYHRVGCVACHAPQDAAAEVGPSVPLPRMEEKWTHAPLRQFLLDPSAVRPSGRMPAMGLTDREASDIAHYLLRATRVHSPLEATVCRARLRSLADLDTAEAVRTVPVDGFTLAVPGADGRLALRFNGWLRVDVAGNHTFRLSADGATRLSVDGDWIEDVDCWDRDATKAEGSLQLSPGWHAVRLDFAQRGSKPPRLRVEMEGPGIPRGPIAAERLRADREVGPGSAPVPFVVDPAKAERGKALFASLDCATCHDGKMPAKATPELVRADPVRGCLADTPAPGVPGFALSDAERVALRSALAGLRRPDLAAPSSQQRVAHSMATFRCTACHVRDGAGGVTAGRDRYFTSNGEDLGEEGRLPPRLDGVGDKLRPAWLGDVLAKGTVVRPYLDTRMPRFGATNVGHLAALFVALDRRPRSPAPMSDTADAQREAGRTLVGTDGLSCIACHRFNRQPAHALQVLDLTTTTERLNEDWFRAFLREPERFNVGTRMPSFWPGGASPMPALLGGDTDRQHAAIWTYLADGARAKAPEGLSRESMELVVGGEAVLYRGKLWEAGFRAVAAGYPEQVDMAFDAEESRLALLWRGRFLNAGPHWGVQGMGQIRPLGTDVVVLPRGPAFAVLADAAAAWPTGTGRGPATKFRGYQLDALKRPTLLYTVHGTEVEDFLAGAVAEGRPAVRRTLRFRGVVPAGLHLRLASGKLAPVDGDAWQLDGMLKICVQGGTAIVRGEGGRKELLVPIDAAAAKDGLEIVYAW